jgi:hypothetical protein
MLPNRIPNPGGSPPPGTVADAPTPMIKPPQKTRSVFELIAGLPGGLLALVRAGKMAGASVRCLLASLLAFAFLFAWGAVLMIVLLVLGVPMAVMSDAAWADVVFQGVLIVLALPGLIAGLILVAGTLLGAALGFAGLFRSQDNKLLGVGSMVLNLLLLVFFLIILLLAVGLAG